jgi:hypothetical protein
LKLLAAELSLGGVALKAVIRNNGWPLLQLERSFATNTAKNVEYRRHRQGGRNEYRAEGTGLGPIAT